MITRAEKEQQAKLFSEELNRAQASFLVGFNGLSVQEMTKMRKELKTEGSAYLKVFRNKIVEKALRSNKKMQKIFQDFLKEDNAFVFAFDSPSRVAKILSNHAEETDKLKIKIAVIGETLLQAEEVKAIGNLPSMDVLRGQFLSFLSGSLSRFLFVLSAVPKAFLYLSSRHKDAKNKNE